jgi:hypothetical protein
MVHCATPYSVHLMIYLCASRLKYKFFKFKFWSCSLIFFRQRKQKIDDVSGMMKVLELPNDLQNRIQNYYGTARLMERKWFYFNPSKRFFLLCTFYHLYRLYSKNTSGFNKGVSIMPLCSTSSRIRFFPKLRYSCIILTYKRQVHARFEGFHHIVLNSNFHRFHLHDPLGSILSRLSAPFRRRNSEGSVI